MVEPMLLCSLQLSLHSCSYSGPKLMGNLETSSNKLIVRLMLVGNLFKDLCLQKFFIMKAALDNGFASTVCDIAEKFKRGAIGLSVSKRGLLIHYTHLIFKSIARCGLIVALKKKEMIWLYNIEKSDCDKCTEPRTVQRNAGASCSFASFMRDMTASKLGCQYMKASELMPNIGI
jgi:hypothetical protein